MFQFDADIPSVDEGIWMEFGESKFLIAHVSNTKFQRALARLQAPHRTRIANGTIDPKVSKDLVCRAMSEGVLLDWANVVDKDQKPTTYTSAAGYTALSRNPEFRDFVSEVAASLSNYRAAEVEEVGND